ncbi:hypothetical protein FACS1894124_7660 [Spirochaetia bacterium]|nr:hypothetical protein FACS1894124_7660 [Spirochaetia bacterium]
MRSHGIGKRGIDFFIPIRYTYGMLRVQNARSKLLLCIILAGLSIFAVTGFAQEEETEAAAVDAVTAEAEEETAAPGEAPEVEAADPGEETPAATEKVEGPAIEMLEDAGDILPEALKRPQRGEAPHYPQDVVIGVLGRGSAPDAAYRLARNILTALLNNEEAEVLSGLAPLQTEEIARTLEPVSPTKFRIGGGNVEPDGSASFLFRFIGREQSAAGELYVRVTEEGTWVFDDILLEDPQDAPGKAEPYPYDFTPYERFF